MRTRASALIFCLLILTARPLSATAAPFRVVLDPGHGGADHGTIFENGRIRVAEKDVTLALAQAVKNKLKAKGFWVMLTREGDGDLGLQARTALANKSKGDLFISLHMNSAASRGITDAGGIETYILNHTSDEVSMRLAHFENAAIQKTGSTLAGAEVVSDNLDVELILKDLRLNANLSESKLLACSLQSNLVFASAKISARNVATTAAKNRGVKQSLFYVLMGADMPSALVEAGFLANPRDRALVLSPGGRETLAGAIARAIEEYRQVIKSNQMQLALSRCKVH